MISDDLATVEPLAKEDCTHELDVSRPLAEVVADLVLGHWSSGAM
jgi:hypothetical protein